MELELVGSKTFEELSFEYLKEMKMEYLVDKCIEEMAELIQSLIKVKNGKETDLAQELADVMVTLYPVLFLVSKDDLKESQDSRITKIVSHLQELRGKDGIIAKTH